MTAAPKPLPQAVIDAARYMRDAVNLHVVALTAEADATGGERRVGFVAINLGTGKSTDGVLYDTRRDVFRHHPHERAIFAVKVGADTMSEREAIIVLQMARQAYSRGVVFSEEEPVTPHLTELLTPYLPNTLRSLN